MSGDAQRHDWPFYCEENVWHRCAALPQGTRDAQVAFISNPTREVRIVRQRAGRPPTHAIVWDYHVILLLLSAREQHGPELRWQVLDSDTTLPCPVSAQRYLRESFPDTHEVAAPRAPLFRLIPAALYRRELRSDRRHMRKPDGSWRAPPPPWPPIGHGSNLDSFIAMDRIGPGKVFDLHALRRHLGMP